MHTEAIITTLLSAAAFLKEPIRAIASQSLRDVYEATRYYLRKKFGVPSRAATALKLATDKPESEAAKAMLIEESAAAGLEADSEVTRLAQTLASILTDLGVTPAPNVRVNGHHNRVQVAAGDIVNTERHVVRNAITPGDSHLDPGQCAQLRAIIAEVANRLADETGAPNFAAVHRQLQRRFGVASYLLIPRQRFADAVVFLKRQRAIHRSRLRRRNPAAYAHDFLRAIHARARELGWNRERLCAFATERLGLRQPIASVRELGSNQLRALAELLRRQPAAVKPA